MRQIIKPRGWDWMWVGPERDDAEWWAEDELTYVRERPIPEIDGEMFAEWRARQKINERWIRYEAGRVRLGLPIVLPWGGSKRPEREAIRLAERPRKRLVPPETGREVRDARQKRLARKAKSDRKARNALMVEMLPLVEWQAQKQRGLGVDLEDLVQEGMLGVAAAIKAYVPRRGASFATYAATWAHGSMRRAIANQGRAIRVPEYRTLKAGAQRKVRERVQQELGRTPTDLDVAQAIDVPVEDVWRAAVESAPIASVDVMVAATETAEEESGYTRYLLDPAGDPEAIVMRKVVPGAVREALGTLKGRDRAVVFLRYWNGQTRRDIAERLGITEKATRYSEECAIKTLRADENLYELEEFFWN